MSAEKVPGLRVVWGDTWPSPRRGNTLASKISPMNLILEDNVESCSYSPSLTTSRTTKPCGYSHANYCEEERGKIGGRKRKPARLNEEAEL